MSWGEGGGGHLQLSDGPADDAYATDGTISLDQLVCENMTKIRETVGAEPEQRKYQVDFVISFSN